ncbi:flagellar FlbD family protein, partial [bacterium]|nr:flagellar FlbD family protein [bacterium]
MITVKKINDTDLIINAELIEFIESTPDTLISTSTGKKIMVKETPKEVIDKV